MIFTENAAGGGGELEVYACTLDNGVPPGKTFGPVVRDVFILECCTAGEGRNTVNGKKFSLRAGEVMVFFPGDVVLHETVGKTPRYGYSVSLKGARAKELFARAGVTSLSPFLPAPAAEKTISLAEKMLEMNRENDAGAELRRTALLYEIFGEILRRGAVPADESVYISRALRLAEARFAEGVTVSELARAIGLDRSYFSTLFKRKTGVPPKDYLFALRLRRAKQLLRESAAPVREVALACGIPPEIFSRVFREKTGLTPLEYRKKETEA